MSGANGLIVAFVVAVWAAYFVPLVLRRYDDAAKDSSLESLSPLSRVIGRGRRASSGDAEAQPGAASHPESIGVVEASDSSEAAARSAAGVEPGPNRVVPQVSRRAAAIAARRRRNTLLTLLAGLLLVAGLVGFSVIAPVWLAVPVGLIVAWLVACRLQVRQERGISTPKRDRLTDVGVGRTRGFARGVLPKWGALGAAGAVQAPGDADQGEDTVIVAMDDVEPDRPHLMEDAPLAEDALDQQVVIAVPSVTASGTAVWDPLPVTVPTYVTKPRAGRTVRTIDFDAPGAWTSGHVEGENVVLPGRSGEAEQSPLAVRRASGE